MIERERGLDVAFPPMPMTGWPPESEGGREVKNLFAAVASGDSFFSAYRAVELASFFEEKARDYAKAFFCLLDEFEEENGL